MKQKEVEQRVRVAVFTLKHDARGRVGQSALPRDAEFGWEIAADTRDDMQGDGLGHKRPSFDIDAISIARPRRARNSSRFYRLLMHSARKSGIMETY